MSEFEKNIMNMVTSELLDAMRGKEPPDRLAATMEVLADATVHSVIASCRGDREMVNELLEGLTAHMWERAAEVHMEVAKIHKIIFGHEPGEDGK